MLRAPSRRWSIAFLALVAVAAAVVFVLTGSLRPDLRKDEAYYWPAAVHFARHPIPSLETLRACPAPTTPLQFMVWGVMERLTGRGLVLGRALNAALAVVITAIVLLPGVSGPTGPARAPRERPESTPPPGDRSSLAGPFLASLGLLAFPYFLGAAVHLYTDIPAMFFTTAGLALSLRARHALSAICMALAISCRQYMVAFPAAIVLWELSRCIALRRPPPIAPILCQALAGLTLLGWIGVYGGLAPSGASGQFAITTADPATVLPRNSLYALACVGAYFVAPEAVLFRRVVLLREVLSPRAAILACALAALFFFFPPLRNENYPIPAMGFLDRALRAVMPDTPRLVVLWALASLAAARFGRPSLAGCLVLANVLILMKAHIGWDKYAMPAIGALWLLSAWGAGAHAAGSSAATPPHRRTGHTPVS